jgi:hypothetical protein
MGGIILRRRMLRWGRGGNCLEFGRRAHAPGGVLGRVTCVAGFLLEWVDIGGASLFWHAISHCALLVYLFGNCFVLCCCEFEP